MSKFIIKRVVLYTAFLLFIVPVLIFIAIGFSAKDKGQNTAESGILENFVETTSDSVPLPSKEDTVRSFCNLIDEGRVSEAVNMMNTEEDTEKQAWGVTFNSFSSFKLISTKPSSIDDTGNSFEVDIDAVLKSGKESYGWINGINKRWINLVEYEKGKYKIVGIATGP